MWIGFPSDPDLWLEDLAPAQAEVAALAQLGWGQGFEISDAGGCGGLPFERNVEALRDQKMGDLFQQRAYAPRLVLANDRSVTKANGHASH